ncbi:PA2169 family four-helix-bundle protein [Flavobacterium jejuense]|uniref:PA2169 family four-helix-bundle protein n=1 Tax=Flavobacterium jejuense TaxID=1544455 RepID=A0ABX0IKR2_9FLAO|nr:PA2169 family four-helix-bundle protein [Flavobacterium jejuense]NHN24308.1 PA2169 family four-helix-bundle protein [Flavobacterium jejuense]
METKKNIEILNGLISILEDGRVGYTNAAENCEDANLKTEFFGIARERALMVIQLQDEINNLGKSTSATDGPLGAIHRAWIDFKSIVTGHKSDAIIEACLTGEEAALSTFKEAIKNESLTPHLFSVISSQLMMIEKSIGKVKAYKDITV